MPPSTRHRRPLASTLQVDIKQVAHEAGVSTATVSRVLSGRGPASDDARRQVLDAANRLDYQPSAFARSLRTDRSMIIGVLVPNLANPVFLPFLRAVEHLAQRHGYAVLVADTQRSAEVERLQLNRLRAQRVDALIMADTPQDRAHVRRLADAGVVVVDPDTFAEGTRWSVSTLEADATREACRHLAGLGHRRVAYLTRGAMSRRRSPDRWRLINATCRSLGIEAVQVRLDRHRTAGAVAAVLEDLLGSDLSPTTVWSNSHLLAPEILRAMADGAVDIPGHCSFLTFGDSPWAAAYRPSISVITSDLAAVAEAMTASVLHRLGATEAPEPPDIEPAVFLARQSTGPPPPEPARESIR
jgi:LacI family transcriptional regulator